MSYNAPRALELLRLGTQNPDTCFHDGQEDAIRHVVEGRGRLLVVQKTGWGKSFVYFIATKLLREQGVGPALLISPIASAIRSESDNESLMAFPSSCMRCFSGSSTDYSLTLSGRLKPDPRSTAPTGL